MKRYQVSQIGLKLPIIFEHYTEVPGLGDSIRHIDAFLAICERLGTSFLRRPFKNLRSSVSDLIVSDAIGLSEILNVLSCSACQQLTSGNILECDVDFNAAVSGESDGIKGSMLMREKTIEDLYVRLDASIACCIKGAAKAASGDSDCLDGLPYDAIKVRFAVRGTSLVTRFSDGTHLKPYTVNSARKICAATDDAVRVVIHLRRGDITIFPYRDKFIASWGDFRKPTNRSAVPEIIDAPAGSIYQNYAIGPYIDLASRLCASVERPIKVTLISDGFARGVDRVRQYAADLGLSEDDLQDIERAAMLMERDLLRELARLEASHADVEAYIGEDGDKFRKSFEAIASADVLLFSSGSFAKTTFSFFNYREGLALGPCVDSSVEAQLNAVTDALESMGVPLDRGPTI